ncbi:MAG: glycoside hydrolase family 16 protein [Anaerolineales bacterium]|nr:glycoside hydrolase family 16 protein [Anaerolineales bacterium]
MSPLDFLSDSTEHELIFWDDFSLGQLDRSKWNVRTTGKIHNNEQQAYVDSTETIYILPEQAIPGATNGALVIHPRYHPGFKTPEGESFDFVSGRIDTNGKFDFKYGSAAIRMKLPTGSGLWPAFWALGYGKWPNSGEIDIMEYVGEPDWTSGAVHGPGYYGESGLVNKKFFTGSNDATSWHIYSVDWFPDKLIFKVDGETTYRVTHPMTRFFGSWAFDDNKYLLLNFALGGTYPFKTNGVQTPYYGLPESTVQSIKTNQIKIIVDWVQVRGLKNNPKVQTNR